MPPAPWEAASIFPGPSGPKGGNGIAGTTIVEDEAGAKYEAERQRPGLVIFTDGSRTEGELDVEGTQVAHRKCTMRNAPPSPAPLRRRPASPFLRTAIWRMTSGDPGPGQRNAIAARKHIAELRRKEPEIRIAIRWCPSSCGSKATKADQWAKHAADEPEARGAEWHRYRDRCGRKSVPTCSLAHIKRKCSEAKWTDSSKWVKAQLQKKLQQIPA